MCSNDSASGFYLGSSSQNGGIGQRHFNISCIMNHAARITHLLFFMPDEDIGSMKHSQRIALTRRFPPAHTHTQMKMQTQT